MKPSVKLIRKVVITNELGLHARAAAQIAKLAEGALAEVYIVKDGQEVDATDILDIIALYCPCGVEVAVRVADPADEKVLKDITRLIETGFGES